VRSLFAEETASSYRKVERTEKSGQFGFDLVCLCFRRVWIVANNLGGCCG